MYVSTTKSYSNISLSEVKEGLKIALSDSSYDGEISMLIQTAVQYTEGWIGQNVVHTVSVLEDNCVYGNYYRITEPNITLSAITATSEDGVITSIPVSGVTIFKDSNSTTLKFPTSLNAFKLVITYTSGYAEEIPAMLRRAIIIKIRELFDQGDQYMSNTMISSKAFERLVSTYVVLTTR